MDKDSNIPFEDQFFDVVVAWNVLYYNSYDRMKTVLNDLYRALKPGGRFLSAICRGNDIVSLVSKEISKKDRVVNKNVSDQSGAVINVLKTEAEIKEDYSIFNNLEIGYCEIKLNNILNSYWIIYGEKSWTILLKEVYLHDT